MTSGSASGAPARAALDAHRDQRRRRTRRDDRGRSGCGS
jgi:hypothetical protein